MQVKYGWQVVFTSSIGQKLLMSLAGCLWLLFVVVHMLGNLLIFAGSEAYNLYSYKLTSSEIVELLEIVLLASLIWHAAWGGYLNLKAKGNRPQGYDQNPLTAKRGSVASRFLVLQGLGILVFLAIHLSMFKFGPRYEVTINQLVVRDLYTLVAEKMSQFPWYGLYVLSLVILAFHLKHAVKAVAQTWGFLNLRNEPFVDRLSWLFSLGVTLGYLAPVTYLFLKGTMQP